jgi:hypothetical protein
MILDKTLVALELLSSYRRRIMAHDQRRKHSNTTCGSPGYAIIMDPALKTPDRTVGANDNCCVRTVMTAGQVEQLTAASNCLSNDLPLSLLHHTR